MKKKYLTLSLVSIFMLHTFSCQQQVTEDLADLQEQIDELTLALESNNNVTEVLIEGGQLLLVFEDGTSVFADLPAAPIPYIGDNGNWFIGDTDLGQPAVAQIPVVGQDGNWYVDGEDTGVSAEGTNGDGVANVTYDQTTGILEITLDSGTVYSFELYFDDVLKAVKLEDLNGEFLLSTIYNGDIPFAQFSYDINNRLTDVSYFTTLLNEPVEYLNVHKELDGSGNILSQTITEYATKNIAEAEYDNVLPSLVAAGVSLSVEDAFTLLFPTGIGAFTGGGATFFPLMDSDENINIFLSTYYVLEYDSDENVVRVHLRESGSQTQFGYSRVSSVDYIWTPEYSNNEWLILPSKTGVESSTFVYSATTGQLVFGASEAANYYPLASIASQYTGDTDVVTPDLIEDYIGTLDSNVESPVGTPKNQFRALFNSYELFNAGDEVRTTTLTYSYDDADFTITETEENEDIIQVVVSNDLITDLYIRDFDDDNNQQPNDFVHILHFEYTTSGQLEFVSLPDDQVTDAIRVTYDTQGNPIEFEVNPSKMEDIADGETLAVLGLSFAFEEYDEDIGAVVEKYAYPDEYITMISVDYNYGLKNFLNHTFTAMNPLLTMFDNQHAIEKIGWAGHGSALLSEYTDFNDGGYPTEIKAYIQVSASDILSNLDEEDLEIDFGVPFNGSVAVTYRLEYIEKQ